jgi:hypothetical protein
MADWGMDPGALKRQRAEVMLTFLAPIPTACQWRLVAGRRLSG